MADLLIARLGQPAFNWGGPALGSAGEKRRAYLEVLRSADARDYQLLLKFARSG